MADTRDQMLVDFQAFTGIEDVDTCTAILTQHDWNLELAVNSILHDESPTEHAHDAGPARLPSMDIDHSLSHGFVRVEPSPMVVDEDPSASSGPSGSSGLGVARNNVAPIRMINFTVEYRNRNVPIVLPDSATVGKIKEMLEAELGIPVDKQELKGLVKRRVDESTILRDLHLPKENVLYLLTPKLCSPTDGPSTADKESNLHKNDDYKLQVVFRNGSAYRMYSLRFKGSKKIGEVKQDLFSLINIPARNQEWTGWPAGSNDNDCLCTCGISFPEHALEVTEKISVQDSQPRHSKNVSMDSDGEDSDEELGGFDMGVEEELFGPSDIIVSRRAPLMSPDNQPELDALEQFTREFAERYGEIHPVFYLGSLDQAIQDALLVKPADRKLLAIYLHHDDSIQVNVFCMQLLCSENVVNFLSTNFLTWAWDLTHPTNLARLVNMATKHFGSVAANQIRSYSVDRLPALLLISRSKATNEIIDVIQGHVTLDELLTRLLHSVEVFNQQKERDIAEERERQAREMIKEEQDRAYQESLDTDRKKAEAAREEERRLQQQREKELELQWAAEKRRQEEEAVKEAIKESVAKAVPDEPPVSATNNVSCLKFRVPGGKVLMRRFWTTNTLQDVLNFLTAQGYHTQDYKVITTYPRRDLTLLGPNLSLQDLKLYPQETLILEEK